jgi:hypothetical protein
MDELLNKIKLDIPRLKRFISTSAARELSALSSPCYYPKTKKFYFELLNILRIKDKDFKEFVKRTYKDTKAEKWVLWRDPGTNLLVFVMYLFLKKRDQTAFISTMIYYMIIQYSRLMHKQIKYCYEDTFKYTLDNLTRTHLFFREKTIPNSLYYLANEMKKNYQRDIANWNIEKIIAFIGVARHRISQSVKSFAENYYKYRKEGSVIKTQIEDSDDESNAYQYKVLERGQKIVDDVVKKISIYKVIDHKAFEEAKNITKIKTSIATLIADKLTNEKNSNNIKIALQLFIKNLTDVSMICGRNYVPYVKKLMAIKKTTAQLYFKAQINIILMDVLKDMKFMESYQKYTAQTQFIINSFLAFYITSIMKNMLCKS